jgi:hypothetical protein
VCDGLQTRQLCDNRSHPHSAPRERAALAQPDDLGVLIFTNNNAEGFWNYFPDYAPGDSTNRESIMTLDELQKMIIDGERGLVSVVVSQSPKSDLTFEGSLAEYLATLDVCASSKPLPILIEQFPFGERTFLIKDQEALVETEAQKFRIGKTDIEPAMLDVRDLAPELRRYEQYIGQAAVFVLTARLGDSWPLRWTMTEPWYEEFEEDYDAIEEALKVKAKEKRQQAGEAQNQRKAELLTKLRTLADDPEFASLKAHRAAQRAMKTYAFEHIPGLEELGADVIREEISLLSDKVAVKGKG